MDKQSISVEYEAGIPGSLFNKDAKYTSWTPNHLGGILDTLRLSTLHSKGKIKEIEGITTPYLYRGNPGTAFGLHVEDDLLYAYSYNHGPCGKLWYIIPPKYADKLRNALKADLKDEYENCAGFCQHKNLLISPQFLYKNDIPFARVVQNSGEIMVLYPNTYHFGFNMGQNVAEAVNYANNTWLNKRSEFIPMSIPIRRFCQKEKR